MFSCTAAPLSTIKIAPLYILRSSILLLLCPFLMFVHHAQDMLLRQKETILASKPGWKVDAIVLFYDSDWWLKYVSRIRSFYITWFSLQIACNDTFTSCVQQTEIPLKSDPPPDLIRGIEESHRGSTWLHKSILPSPPQSSSALCCS